MSSVALANLQNARERVAALGYDYRKLGTVEVSRCPVCRCGDRQMLATRDRYGYEVECFECSDCGTVYLNPQLSKAGYADLYENWYRKLLTARYGYEFDSESIVESQVIYGRAVWPALAKFMLPRHGQALLDVGGSTGIHADMAREVYKVVPTVLDPAIDELAKAEEKGCETILGTLSDIPLWRKFDVITLFQSIEHLPDPVRSLFAIRSLMNDDGVFIWDHRPFDEQRAKHHVEQIIKIDHPIYLSQYAAKQLIERAGLRLVEFLPITGGHFHYVCCKASRRVFDFGHAIN